MNMKFNRRTLLASLATLPLAGHAQDYPTRPITVVVPSAPGGFPDLIGRTLSMGIAERLNISVVVENKPGGNGHIGSSYVAKAKPDGYTLLSTSGATLISGVVRNLNYDPVNELIPVARIVVTPVILVVAADSPYKSVSDLVAAAKAKPGGLFFGSTNAGNSTHIAAEMLNVMANVKTIHVPYKGSGPALQDLIGGRLQFMFDTRPTAIPLAEAGKLRILAVSSPQRQKDLPDVPTVAEAIPGFQLQGWGALFAPAATPLPILEKLALVQKSVLDTPEYRKRLSAVGEIAYLPPVESRSFMLQDHEWVSKIVRTANIQVN